MLLLLLLGSICYCFGTVVAVVATVVTLRKPQRGQNPNVFVPT